MRVMVGIPAYRDLPAATVISLFETARLCPYELVLCIISDCSLGAFAARNLVADAFLKSDCTHLFWVDADMSWEPVDFIRLLELDQPFVAVAGPKRRDPPVLAMVDGIPGLCFACIRRDVVEALAAIKPNVRCHGRKEPIRQIFHCGVMDGKLMGEDYLFGREVEALGYPLTVLSDVKLGHIGTKEYRL